LLFAMRSDGLKKILAQIYRNPGIYCTKIAENTGLSRATVSGHVKYLEEQGIVQAEREGRYVLYTISDTYSHALTEYVDRCPKPARVPAEHAK
jgi:predicted transcriptional regulator